MPPRGVYKTETNLFKRPVSRLFLCLLLAAAPGCFGPADVSWLHHDTVGRTVIVIAPVVVDVPVDPGQPRGPTTQRTLPIGTRAVTTKAYYEHMFLQRDTGVEARLADRGEGSDFTIGNYDGGRLLASPGRWLALPRKAPAWLDVTATPPSADTATMSELIAALYKLDDDALPSVAAVELARRAVTPEHPNRAAALGRLGGIVRESRTWAWYAAAVNAVASVPPDRRDALVSTLAAAITDHERLARRVAIANYGQDAELRHLLALPPATRPGLAIQPAAATSP